MKTTASTAAFCLLGALFLLSLPTTLPCDAWDCDCVFKHQRSCCCVYNKLGRLSVDTFHSLDYISDSLSQLQEDIVSLTGEHYAFKASIGQPSYRCFGPFTRNVPVPYNNVTLNDGRAYNPALGIFTARFDGIYSFTFTTYSNLIAPGMRQYVQLQLMKNGEPVVGVWEDNREDSEDSSTQELLLPLERGDQVYIELVAGRYLCGDLKYNVFSGFLLYPN
uniref:Cerebellin 18 n=1 Tax=Scleropages formosus TaxID=113540 RepID=A0A8C9RZP8_SCLFO